MFHFIIVDLPTILLVFVVLKQGSFQLIRTVPACNVLFEKSLTLFYAKTSKTTCPLGGAAFQMP